MTDCVVTSVIPTGAVLAIGLLTNFLLYRLVRKKSKEIRWLRDNYIPEGNVEASSSPVAFGGVKRGREESFHLGLSEEPPRKKGKDPGSGSNGRDVSDWV